MAFDLVKDFSLATVRQPTTTIDLGQRSSQPYLISGWYDGSFNFNKAAGGIGTWSLGSAAEIEFFVAKLTDLEVDFRCAPVVAASDPPWTLSLQVNGRDWQTLSLEPSMHEYRLELPVSFLEQGENRMRIIHTAPARAPTQAFKDIRVLWDYIRLGEDTHDEMLRPFARTDIDVVFIPFDNRLDFFLELPGQCVLTALNVRSRGSPTGRLKVVWRDQEGQDEVLAIDYTSTPKFRLPFGRPSGSRGRLSLFALSANDRSEASTPGIIMESPKILAGGPAAEVAPAEPGVAQRPPGESTRSNVIIYLVDTLRADHLGCYGYDKVTSPHIDRFAQDGYLFENAQAQAPWTRASVASIFTGLWPQVHGANDDPDTLAGEAKTLAESLKELGYYTAAVTGNGNAHGPWGFDQGFDYFKYLSNVRSDEPLVVSEDINKAVFPLLDELSRNQPFLLFVHTIDPHAPYDPPEPYRSRLAGFVEDPEIGTIDAIEGLSLQHEPISEEQTRELWALYDGEIAANDESFGRFLAELDKHGFYEDSLIIFLSDHGEEFNDHGQWTHGKTLYSEMLDVPLIVKLPRGGGPVRVRQMVQHVDLYPTILQLVSGQAPNGIQGHSLLPLLSEETAPWRDLAVASVDLRGRSATSLIDGSWKVIQRHDAGQDSFPELYDRGQDRAEKHNLAPAKPTLANLLATALKAQQASLGAKMEPSAIDSKELEKVAEELRALGYLQ